jgi:uncharacterized protein (TIGR02246 family)
MLCVMVAWMSACLVSSAQESAANSGIKKTVDEFAANWNKHDPVAMANEWTQDGDLINPQGRIARGRDQVAQLFSDEHTSGPFGKSTMTMAVLNVREISAEYAMADLEATVTGANMGPNAPSEQKFHVANVMKNEGGTWKIVSCRPYVFMSPPPAPAAAK